MSGAISPPPPMPMPPPGGAMGGPPPAALAALGRMMPQGGSSLPGLGAQADGLAGLKSVVGLLQNLLPKFEAGSEVHSQVTKAIATLSKHLPTGQEAQGIQASQLIDLMRQHARNVMLARVLQGGGGAPAPGVAPATPPAGV